MSNENVYDDEMLRAEMTHRDVERVLTGEELEDAALTRLHTVLSALHPPAQASATDEQMASLAVEAAALTRDTRPESRVVTVADDDRRTRPLLVAMRERLALVAVAFLVAVGMTGVAVASDAAVPGDPLYGLDRALEVVGIGDGGTPERIAEARVLASSGRVVEAIDHVATAIAASSGREQVDGFSPETANATAALRDAAASVESDNAAPESQEVRDAVASMLDEMALIADKTDFGGAEFGRRIAEMARAIGSPDSGQDVVDRPGERGQDSKPGDGAGPPSDVPSGPPDGAGRP